MRVTLRLFAVLRDVAGEATLTVEVHSGSTARDAFFQTSLGSEWVDTVAFARNNAMIHPSTVLEPNDVIDCLPPVSGG
jgi:molybdopterin converting factor small subunit